MDSRRHIWKVTMKRIVTVVAFGVLIVALVMTNLACSGDLEATEEPELQVENLELELPQLAPDDRSQTFSDNVYLRNAGAGDLEITSIDWIDRPERVEAYHGDRLECSQDSDCGDQGSCDADGLCTCVSTSQCPDDAVCVTDSQRCFPAGFSELPQTVRTDATYSHDLIVVDGEQEVDCPDRNSPDAPSDYCGAIEVETNARNSGEQVQSGTATVYLTATEGSGMLELPSTFVEFTEAQPGQMQTEQFQVVNAASSPLEFSEINFASNSSWFNISPPPHEITVDGDDSKWITIEMTPPSDATEEEMDFMSGVTFNTSSITTEPSMTVSVTPGIGDAPIMEVEPMQLSFEDGLTQPLIIHNHGTAALPLNSMEIRPPGSDAQDAYDVYYNGTDVVSDSGALPTVSPGDSEEFSVEFDPGQVQESAIGILRINHYASMGQTRTEIDLLGDSPSVALGELSPSQLYFRSNQSDGEVQERELAVANLGIDDLVVDEIELDTTVGTTSEEYFEVEGLDSGTAIGAGEIGGFTVRYTGSTEMEQGLVLRIHSNHAGASNAMVANISAVPLTEPTMEITIDPSFPQIAQVDEAAVFEVSDASGQAQLNAASWTLHDRPAGSEASLEGQGEEASLVPDVAGQYRISVTVRDGDNRQVQKMLTFEAE